MDIQLGNGWSFQIFEQTDCRVPFIFCTAFDECSLKAFKTFGVDCLPKPFLRASVSSALEKSVCMKSSFAAPVMHYTSMLNLLRQPQQPGKIPSVVIHQADKIIPLDSAQPAISYIDDADVMACTFDRKKHVLPQKLDALEKLFRPAFFCASRQYLISRMAVEHGEPFSHRIVVGNLTIPFSENVMVGTLKVTSFME